MSTQKVLKDANTKQLAPEFMPKFDDNRRASLPILRPEQMAGHWPDETWKDAEGRKWGLGQDKQGKYVKFRYYRHSSGTACEGDEGHLVRPKKWPIPEVRNQVGEPSVAVDCELCGAWLIVENSWETDPPPGVRVVLPETKKGKA